MKIGPPPEALLNAASGARPGTAAPAAPLAKGPQGPAAPASDVARAATAGNGPGVSVSKSASAAALQQADASADVDTAKVQAMREAIANGSFRVNAEAIADKLLANAQEMLERAARR